VGETPLPTVVGGDSAFFENGAIRWLDGQGEDVARTVFCIVGHSGWKSLRIGDC
jgi:hypothetical protein